MDSDLVKYNEKTQHSETTEDTKKRKKPSPEESQPRYHFQWQSERSQYCFDINNN